MSNKELRETLLVCQNSQGLDIRGTLLKLSRHDVAFEVYAPGVVLRASEVLSDLKIYVNDSLLYSGRGTVTGLVQTTATTVCNCSLEEGWVDIDLLLAEGTLDEGFREFMQRWQKNYRILPEYKIVIADLQSFLMDLKLWLEQIELGIRSSPSADRIKLEEETARKLGGSTTPAITTLFEKFEEAAQKVEPELEPAHRAFSKRQLHPLLLCAPFLYRTYQKPLGYAGDYEMVNMIVRDPFEGSSLFAKVLNLWFLEQAPAQAHRNRISHLQELIQNAAARATAAGRPARVLSLGCGPAAEVERFIKTSPLADQTHFTLLDFNEETLTYAQSVLEDARQRSGRRTTLEYGKRSVNQILKEAAKSVARSASAQFDFVYCAGLFDYLSDPVCQRLSNILYDWVAPGGSLLTTNVDRSNPRRITMDYIMEWHLIYRSGAELAALRPSGSADVSSVQTDLTGVNIYFEAKKPSSG